LRKLVITVLLLVLYCWQINATELVTLTVKFWDGTYEVRQYDINTEELRFPFAQNVVEIVGLDEFPNLRELWLERTAFMNDFNFLRRIDTLETLVFFMVTLPDIDFLYDLISLRGLVFQSVRINNKIGVDVSRLPNLEYFEFTHSQLVDFPILIEERRSISVINIASNNITDISGVENMGILLIAKGNPIQYTGNTNIITGSMDNFFHAVPERYRRFVR